ncbi:DUF3558 domain-containing protein [Streptomyces sp. ISL-66]|uniref:DUF3558 domain-containing protein n=1 Tax=Streptomyces sp. ISL-66 TaxID=2819186 RepID=UPI001BE8E082|nr:DUF3558 domain-containing protein [Streptomyces sp. ISL-66]MBT2471225.1 DUF3558 domain-containing protein [Streptomyces sp. ISL-66]
MQRKTVRGVRAVLPGIAILTVLTAGLTACTDGDGVGITSDAKVGDSAGTIAQPGKYRILPMPCKAADAKKVKAMLPAADTLTPEQREALYAGVADASYDADRRVGCRWTAQTPAETRLLSVGFERVVSYDRATTSDDDKARQVFVRQLTDAHLPFPGPATTPSPATGQATNPAAGPSPSTSPSTTAGTSTGTGTGVGPSGSASGSASGSPSGSSSGSPSPSAPPELGSRVLEGLGNEAFLDDKLGQAGATAVQARTVRIVFRTSNVIVTVEYSVQPALPGTVPPSGETQDRARQLAQALVERFND